jgi:hypothetical protein
LHHGKVGAIRQILFNSRNIRRPAVASYLHDAKNPLGKLNGNPLDDRHSMFSIPKWNGVAVGVDISLDSTEEFRSLLDNIHKFYAKEVKGQRNDRYKKPRFT